MSDDWVEKHGIVRTGSSAWTGPGNMKNCKYIIHAVGPVWSNGRLNDVKLLTSAVRSTINRACELKCESVAIPAISSGIFGYPKPLCAETLFRAAE
jgi:O-acetyl-ADP-ribose deacetylase